MISLWTKSWCQARHALFYEIFLSWDVHFLPRRKAETTAVMCSEVRRLPQNELQNRAPNKSCHHPGCHIHMALLNRWVSLVLLYSVIAFCLQHFGNLEMVLLWTVLIDHLKQVCKLWALETDVVRYNTLVFRRNRILCQQTCDLMQKHQMVWTGWAAWSQGLNVGCCH